MNTDYRDAFIAASVLILATGLGAFTGSQVFSAEKPDLYHSSFNVTLSPDNDRETVEFDGRSVELVFENWGEFRAYYDNGRYQESINITSDNTTRTTTEIVTVDGASYRFRFRYRDDPESFEGDYIELYRIERIQ